MGADESPSARSAANAHRRILVVEDDPGIRTLLSSTLRPSGYEVLGVATGHEALTGVEQFRPDLLVVDVMLPDLDGYELTRVLRTANVTTPVLFLTARAEATDRVAGLRAGGDDYVTKPFDVRELLLRIRGILHRLHPMDAVPAGEDDGVLRYADLSVDRGAHDVRRAGRSIRLTRTEFRLLTYLMTHPHQVLSKQQIVDHVWSYDFGGDSRIVETYIRYLRRKVDCFDPPLIHNVRGVGYCLRLPPRDHAPARKAP
ncbi:DNA-binding response regulator [Actinoplanes sp. ATCC 53533]|uniref:response regulator transcription factor n=1 Tax=Actinoplanes sp. ATCC 53533 TaxID=1288362 RepID=UPI000F7668B1|nr:response regulator transcription factor [Actinoplanes sp. ATCC 53533]RSM43466.1 DNA-binding response regulator [Actinoplanes sp. ATCC 53533]